MDYMTLKEAAEKWGVTPRRVNYYCAGGRIPGAVKMAGVWLIPKNAEKPTDRRRNYSIFSVNGIEPQIEIPNMDIYLNADRKACIRIIQNLIFNAVTSTTNNVVIQLINIADSVQLCIKNPVASIPTEEYSKLLERFYVADVSRSNGTSGQGLYIVKKLLLMMNCTNPIIEIHDHNFMITIDFSPLLIKK